MSGGLACKDVTAVFRPSSRGVFDVTLTVEPGMAYALLGGNGAGKTTLINACLGLLRPDRGSVRVADMDFAADPVGARRRVAYVPEVARLYGHLDAWENIRFFERLNGSAPSAAAVRDALESLDFPMESSREPLSTYSKGTRQKVVLAMGLVKGADVFLLDEPSSGLDPASARQLRDAVETLRGRGAAILIASHDAHSILGYSDRVGFLRKGRLVCERPSAGMSQADVERLYEVD